VHILPEKRGPIAVLWLNRPDKLNAFNWPMGEELVSFFNEINKDDSIRVVVVTGKGNGIFSLSLSLCPSLSLDLTSLLRVAFCAGADLTQGNVFGMYDDQKLKGENGMTASNAHRDQGGQVSLAIHRCRKPVIAAINGAAVGVGITMTLPMDIRIAAESAKVGFVFARRGIALEAVSSFFLPRVVGIGKALEWASTGRVFTAKEESASGLFNHVVPQTEVLNKALAIAAEIANNTSAVSTFMNKSLLWASQIDGQTPEAQHLLESKLIFWIGRQNDAAEGVMSFKEKRPPKFEMSPWSDLPEFFPFYQRINTERKQVSSKL